MAQSSIRINLSYSVLWCYHYKVTIEGEVTNEAIDNCLAVEISDRKDLLGMWVSESENSSFWLSVLTELRIF
ncbi:Hypothetical protein IALB_0888 [Ignavibacterium album JCM 16511]|uniref:Mutator family transposase n=1 Tax=Ignavibacterium album (strain DSM 19864 / JCM 16511 / NBRC 101810 / Mat9-16) TaxID=945713 RepID=I0AHZ3_IGNAJ|nr:Hypothetical protein IALB_0888 [Ignavibacterium album JCM 16511]